MKKVVASIIIGTLIALPTPVLATDERVNVEKLTFEKIEDYMNTYNAQIDANYDTYHDIEVPASSDKTDLENQINELNAKIAELNLNANNTEDVALKSQYQTEAMIATFQMLTLQNQLLMFDESRDKLSEAKYDALIQIQMGNKQIIWGAEQLFLAYHSLGYQIKQQKSQLEQLTRQSEAMKLRLELGLVTSYMAKGLEKGIKELQFAVDTMKEQQRSIKEQLNVMFNQNYDTRLKIGDMPELDVDLIDEMDFEDDYESAEWKSYSVQLEDEYYQIEAAKRKFKADFWKAYNKVFDQKESLELEEFKLETQIEAFEQAKLKYDLGLISKLSFNEEQITYDNQVMKVQLAKDELFKAYREYEWMKEGLTISSN